MTDKADEIAALRRELDELKSAVKAQPAPPATYDPVEAEKVAREHDNWVHQLREGRANVVPPWLREACAGGVSDGDAQDLVRASHRPQGPSSQGAIPSSQMVSNVRGVPGSGTGWMREVPLGPSMHQRYVDAQLDAQDAKDRRELIERKAREQALLKVAETNRD